MGGDAVGSKKDEDELVVDHSQEYLSLDKFANMNKHLKFASQRADKAMMHLFKSKRGLRKNN